MSLHLKLQRSNLAVVDAETPQIGAVAEVGAVEEAVVPTIKTKIIHPANPTTSPVIQIIVPTNRVRNHTKRDQSTPTFHPKGTPGVLSTGRKAEARPTVLIPSTVNGQMSLLQEIHEVLASLVIRIQI